MRLVRTAATLFGLVSLVGCSVACSSGSTSTEELAQVPESAGRGDDACNPGQAPDAEDQPDAVCALRTDYDVPDLGADDVLETASTVDGSGAATQSLKRLDNPGTARASCNGRNGAGFDTCGSNGTDNCCRSTTVPEGTAGTLRVAKSFDLGVYEVTSGRFAAFIAAVGGSPRAAAQSGQLPGFDPAWAPKLPASRAAVDQELGPACKFRSDLDNYGARTWPSAEVEQTVASYITDNNERAADIRNDAKAARLHAKPINCVSYHMAAAFCAWDGGRLPTNAEWRYAALGGGQLRAYPWGEGRTADRLVTDFQRNSNSFTYPSDFPWYGNGFNAYHIAPPGRKPAGAARWGQHDMAGNLLEWTADVTGPNAGIVRGGSWEGHSEKNADAHVNYPLDRTYGSLGFRCAYGASTEPPPPPPPPPQAETRPVYRAYNGALRDHLQGLTQGEGAPAWRAEGTSFRVYAEAPAESYPLYRCRMNGSAHHFLSNRAGCEGHVREGLLGHVRKGQAQGTRAIYRCVKGRDHLSTLTPRECRDAGFTVEGTQGFALP